MSDAMSNAIEPQYHAAMNALAEAIDDVLGGLGFALLVFELNKVEGGRVNYISNAKREDMLAAMREFVARSEGRVHESPKEQQ